MQLIDRKRLETALSSFAGATVFTHIEVTPGGFARNIPVHIIETYLHGEGPYRAALRLEEQGWIRVEGLTHMVLDENGRLLLAGHDAEGKLTTALELSRTRFD
ncbi:DUF1806 family protein [Paenibacillus chartarius]|uniref:DUF1806 family protein n=1 Tax=Paenibacillus chartarius TaxID=747481 RepID=A0ABV6DSL3_9BACL